MQACASPPLRAHDVTDNSGFYLGQMAKAGYVV